jgi:hypothetical protein
MQTLYEQSTFGLHVNPIIITWHKINCSWNSVLGGVNFIQKCQIPKIIFDPHPLWTSMFGGAPVPQGGLRKNYLELGPEVTSVKKVQ